VALLRCLYLDLDGTLLGRAGSLLHDGEGVPSLLGARAMEACLRGGVEVVLMSGRREQTVREPARLLGQGSYIYEAGAVLVLDGEPRWLTGDLRPGALTVHQQVAERGAPALLLAHFAGRLEPHAPWHRGREVSHLYRGLVDAAEADALLAAHGHDDLRLVDNGGVHAPDHRLDRALEPLRAYHLVPAGASKANAVAAHLRARALEPGDAIAIGDSREDLGVAASVGTFWLVANAVERDPAIRAAAAAAGNVRFAEEGFGAGVYEAVVTTLAER